MHSKEWLFEAETNIRVKRQLDLFSDTDIENVLQMIQLNEQDKNFSYQDYIKTTQKDKSPTSEVPSKNTKLSTKPSKKTSSKTDIENVLKNLSQKDKELLAATLQKEKEQRVQQKRKRAPAKQSVPQTPKEPKKSSGMLGKIVLGLLIGIGAASYFSDEPTQNSSSQVQAEPEQIDANKKFLQAGKIAPYKIKRYIARSAYDEDSLKFRNWKMHAVMNSEDPNSGTWLLVSGEANGKNRLGAYVGFKKFIVSIDPETGEIQPGKYYTEDNENYYGVLALMKSMKTIDAPIIGPND